MAGGSSVHIIVSDVPAGFLKRRIVRGHFSKFGSIVKSSIYNNYCIITFETQEQAEKALVQGSSWKDLRLKIEFTDRHDQYEIDDAAIKEELNWYAEDETAERSRKLTKTKANPKNPDAPPKKTSRLDLDNVEEAIKMEDSKSISTTREVPFHSRTARTLKERLEILDERDRYLRLKLEKIGKIDASNINKGTCPDMCPEKERLMRDLNAIVAPHESMSNGRMDHSKAVKEYTRSSADQDEPLPHELRPEPVLTMTMSYIINHIMSKVDEVEDENFANWYDFCWGRLRAIRKDIIQQQLCDINVVTILEQCARFHIVCYDRLWGTRKSHFDDKINTETLVNCLQSLNHMYEDLHREGIICPNEAEFNAYMILLKLNSGLLISDYRRYGHQVKEAVKIHSAYSNNMFSTYFKLIKQTSYLNACLMQRFFQHLRIQAMNTIVKAHAVPNKVSNIAVNFIMGILKIDSISECVSFCDSLGLPLSNDKRYFKITRNDFFVSENIYAIKNPSLLVVKKRISVARAVVGSDKPLPISFEHTVHSSFNDDGILNPDAIDASDQEDKMIYDILERNVQLSKIKEVSNVIIPHTMQVESEMKNIPLQNSSYTEQNAFDVSEVLNDSSEEDEDYEDDTDTSAIVVTSNDDKQEANTVEKSSDESIASLVSTCSSISSKSSTQAKTPESAGPTTPILVEAKQIPKFNPFFEKTFAPLTKTPGTINNQPTTVVSLPSPVVPKSPLTPVQSQKFSFSNDNLDSSSKVEREIVTKKIDKDEALPKLHKKVVSENFKKITAQKYLKLWQKKVARIKAMKVTEALVICNVSAENHLKIWGHPQLKQFVKTSDRLTERKKASLMVQLILHTDIVDKLDKNVLKISRKLVDTLGETSVKYANKWGNVAQPVPVFWKLVFAIPPPIKESSTFPMKFRIWCKEAFSNKDSSDVSNVAIRVAANGVRVFSRTVIIEGSSGIDQCNNLTSLVLITACDWETPGELERRLALLLKLVNHPVPVVVLSLGNRINQINVPDHDNISYFKQTLWENSNSMNKSLYDLARNIYLSNLKVMPFCNLIEIYVAKLFDFLRQDRYFHEELDVALLSPNNVISLYNKLVDFIENEIASCYRSKCYETAYELMSCFEKLRTVLLWPDNYRDSNFLESLHLRSMKCRLRPFILPRNLTATNLLSFLRLYCDNIGCSQMVSTILRFIKPPKEDSNIKLSDHLDTVDWLRIIEMLIEKVLASTLLEFKVVFREDKFNDFISSRFWLEANVINDFMR